MATKLGYSPFSINKKVMDDTLKHHGGTLKMFCDNLLREISTNTFTSLLTNKNITNEK